MKVLFISRENKWNRVNPIVFNQGESLKKNGIEIDYFSIIGKGTVGYLKNVFILKKIIKKKEFDLFHAHYSLSAFVASLAGCRPLVVSLMGSDVYSNGFFRFLIKIFSKLFWHAVIVKSNKMAQRLKMKGVHVIPNGVNLDFFKPVSKKDSVIKVGFEKGKNIIFVADPKRPEKNFRLSTEAVKRINDPEIRLHTVFDKPFLELIWYYNAADLLLLTSLWEGSPNVVKEAMSCNLPIVSSDVGDVRQIIGDTEGCFICKSNVINISEGIRGALKFKKKTNGRERIKELQLDATSVSRKIISIYSEVLKKSP